MKNFASASAKKYSRNWDAKTIVGQCLEKIRRAKQSQLETDLVEEKFGLLLPEDLSESLSDLKLAPRVSLREKVTLERMALSIALITGEIPVMKFSILHSEPRY